MFYSKYLQRSLFAYVLDLHSVLENVFSSHDVSICSNLSLRVRVGNFYITFRLTILKATSV